MITEEIIKKEGNRWFYKNQYLFYISNKYDEEFIDKQVSFITQKLKEINLDNSYEDDLVKGHIDYILEKSNEKDNTFVIYNIKNFKK